MTRHYQTDAQTGDKLPIADDDPYIAWFDLAADLRHLNTEFRRPWNRIVDGYAHSPVVRQLNSALQAHVYRIAPNMDDALAANAESFAIYKAIVAICREMDALEQLPTIEETHHDQAIQVAPPQS